MTKQDDLIAYVFEGREHRLSGELMQWMEASSRFTDFVETYRDKIRKKIRVNREPESILDLRSELEVAYSLLNDRRLVVAYEPYASAKQRGPDFSITYRANLIFNVEVARIRADESVIDRMGQTQETEPARQENHIHKEDRITRILLNKLGQMLPGMANLLVIQAQEAYARTINLNRLIQEMKIRVEGKDPSFYTTYTTSRYTSPAAFYKDFLHLSGILLWADAATQIWVNKQARPGLEEKVLRLVSLTLQPPHTMQSPPLASQSPPPPDAR